MTAIKHHRQQNQAGFTIMELMIATIVLSVLLLMASVVLISIGKLYTKGSTGSQLQNNTRDVMQLLTNAVEFSSAAPTTGSDDYGPDNVTVKAVCINGLEISYVVDTLPGTAPAGKSTPVKAAIWQSQADPGCTPVDLTATLPSGDTGNIGLPNEAVHSLSICESTLCGGDPANRLVKISINTYAASGNDQLNNIGAAAAVTCNGQTGDQFCYTANLSAVVQRRLESAS